MRAAVILLLAIPSLAAADRCKTPTPAATEELITTPTPMCGVTGAKHVEAGYEWTLVEGADGKTRVYGGSGFGHNGDVVDAAGLATYRKPHTLPVVPDAIQADGDAEDGYGCAVTKRGAVWCWGNIVADSRKPVQIAGITDAVEVRTRNRNACVRTTGGTVRCWGDADLKGGREPPRVIPGATDIVSLPLTKTSVFSCALRRTGEVVCRGDNSPGTLGDGTRTSHDDWRPVVGLAGVTELSVGYSHACALLKDHTVKCWGRNGFGEVGLPRTLSGS